MATRPPRLIFLLNTAQRRLQQWIAAEQGIADNSGIAPTPAQGTVLFILTRTDGATMGELARELDLAPSAISGLVQRMEAAGWVQRRSCDLDARTQRVWLQPAGAAHLPALRQSLARINARLTRGFTSAELDTVARWLEQVRASGDTDA